MHRELIAAKTAMAEQQAKDKASAVQAQVELESKIRADIQEKFRKLERDNAELRARTGS